MGLICCRFVFLLCLFKNKNTIFFCGWRQTVTGAILIEIKQEQNHKNNTIRPKNAW